MKTKLISPLKVALIAILVCSLQLVIFPSLLSVQASCREKRPYPPYHYSFSFNIDPYPYSSRTYDLPYSIENNARIRFAFYVSNDSESDADFNLYAQILCAENNSKFTPEDLSWKITPEEGPWTLQPGESFSGEFRLKFTGQGATQLLSASVFKNVPGKTLIGSLNFTVINWGRTRGLFEQLLISFGIGIAIISFVGIVILTVAYLTGDLTIAKLVSDKSQKLKEKDDTIELVSKEEALIVIDEIEESPEKKE